MKLLVFGASTSKHSINKAFACYAASLVEGAQVEILDLNDFEIPLFSEDREKELGQPKLAQQFLEKIRDADAMIISFAEHNGNYTAAFKNLLDWCSRISLEIYQNKPAIFLSTSPGARGAARALKQASDSAQYFGADLRGSMSLPSFYENFDTSAQAIVNQELKGELINVLRNLTE